MNHNINQLYFAALIINGTERIELGKSDWSTLITRAFANLKSFDGPVDFANFAIGVTKEQLSRASKNSVQAEYAHEGLNPDSPLYGLDESVIRNMQQIEDDTPSPFEGITMNRLMEANTSPEFEAYRTLACNPEKRVGVESGFIEALREAWHEAYPDVAKHIPPWKE